jgi:hypothetical protein
LTDELAGRDTADPSTRSSMISFFARHDAPLIGERAGAGQRKVAIRTPV